MSALNTIDPARQIPVTVLTGFLGAGKTTLLNHLLRQPEFADAAVLINEFGAVGVDHHLVDKVDDNILLLDSGCLCCSVRGDLARALRDLAQRRLRREIPAFSRVLIETTGLADPAPVLHTLLEDFFIAERYRSDGVITAVAAPHAAGQIAANTEALRQVAMADRLLLTQCDLAARPEIDALHAQLATINPGAPRIEVMQGRVDPAALAACGLYDPATKSADVAAWLAEEAVRAAAGQAPARHDHEVRAFVLRFAEPFVWADFAEALDVLLATCGERILRVKGLVQVQGDPLPRVVHAVQHVRYPAASLPAWPAYADGTHDSRLVFIVRRLPREYVEKAFAMFCDAVPVGNA